MRSNRRQLNRSILKYQRIQYVRNDTYLKEYRLKQERTATWITEMQKSLSQTHKEAELRAQKIIPNQLKRLEILSQ